VPEYNFAKVPVVHSLDDFWHRKYDEDENGRAVRKPDADELIARLEHEGVRVVDVGAELDDRVALPVCGACAITR